MLVYLCYAGITYLHIVKHLKIRIIWIIFIPITKIISL